MRNVSKIFNINLLSSVTSTIINNVGVVSILYVTLDSNWNCIWDVMLGPLLAGFVQFLLTIME